MSGNFAFFRETIGRLLENSAVNPVPALKISDDMQKVLPVAFV
jgi:hypothetical protein